MTNRQNQRVVFSLALIALLFFSPLHAEGFVLEGDTPEGDRTSESLRNPLKSSSVTVESLPDEVALDVPEIPNTRTAWEDLIGSADQSVKMGLYYYTSKENTALEELGRLLRKKAEEGVSLKIVADAVFFDQYPDELRKLARNANAQVRILELDDRTGGVMHGKYFVVDEKSYYAGSANFSWKTLKHNRELGLAGTNAELADQILSVFEVDWQLAGPDSPEIQEVVSESSAQSTNETSTDTPSWVSQERFTAVTASPPKLTPPGIRSDLETLVELIDSAEDEIFVDVYQYGLTSPYTDNNLEQLDFALRRASQRGVKIHVLTSTWSLEDPQRSHLESLQAMPNVTVRAIGFPIHSSGYHSYARTSHPKMLLVDGRYAWVGSANWQPGYFSESRNLGLVTNHSTVTEDLKTFFLTAWTSSHAQELGGASPTEKPAVPYHW